MTDMTANEKAVVATMLALVRARSAARSLHAKGAAFGALGNHAMRIHDILEGVAGSLDEMARMIRK